MPSPPARTWFMTLPKSIRGLACLHPKRDGRAASPGPGGAGGGRGRPEGSRGGGRGAGGSPASPGRAGVKADCRQSPPPSPGQAWRRKEGRREGGGRGGKEGESRRISLPASGTPAMEGRRGGPPAPRSPPHPRGGRGLGTPGAPAPALGRKGVPGSFFHHSPPSSRSFSLFLLLFPLSPAARHAPSPAPLHSPRLPQKHPSRQPGAQLGQMALGEGCWQVGRHPPPQKNTPSRFHCLPLQSTSHPVPRGCGGAQRGRGLITPRDATGVPVPLAVGGVAGTGA